MRTTRDAELDRQGFLLLAFDLLVAAIVTRVVGIMVPSTLPVYLAIVLAAGGVLAVMAAHVADASASRGPSRTSGARRAPG
jgi:hypothetical protein